MSETRRKVLALYMIFAVAAVASAVDLAGLLWQPPQHALSPGVLAAVCLVLGGSVVALGGTAIRARLEKRRPDREAIARMEREIYGKHDEEGGGR